jgi:transcriptional regulator GlxA family with amidase domain
MAVFLLSNGGKLPMADFALFAPAGTYHSSAGAMLDAYLLVRRQIERVFYPPEDAIQMETQLRLLTPIGAPVQFAGGRKLPADGGIDTETVYDWVHIPAFETGGPEALRARMADAAQPLEWLRQQHAKGAILSASGAGIFYLVEAGLTGTMALPLPRAFIPLCRAVYPRIALDERRPLVEQGRIVLGNGPGADALLMERLLERTISVEMSRWFVSVIGSGAIIGTEAAKDPMVANAQLWLESRFTQDIHIAELAAAMSASHQTLIRHFVHELGMRPRDYVQHLRVHAAQRMLETTHHSIDRIAALVGYRDVRSFRTVFHEHAGMTATAYRKLIREENKVAAF